MFSELLQGSVQEGDERGKDTIIGDVTETRGWNDLRGGHKLRDEGGF